jgi:agmatine/peptidylarginine deiminase
MEQQLKSFTNALGEKFNLVPLPCPEAIFDEDGNRLPATYANFLITNNQVLVPVYGQQENDDLALGTISKVFSTPRVVGIDCNALIKQHGSLHCITMQIPNKFLKQ